MSRELTMKKEIIINDWELKEWHEVLEIRSGRNQKAVLNPNGKYPIIGSAGKVMGYADKYICKEGTTIIGRKGTINSPLFIEHKFWNVDTAFGLHSKELLDNLFLHYFCLSFDFTELDKGSGRPSLVKSDLLKVQIPLPPLPQQKQIVATLDKAFAAIDAAKANAEQNLKNAKELFESYLQNVFVNKGDDWEDKTLIQIAEVFGRGKSKHRPRNDKKLYGGRHPFIQTGDIRNSKHIITKYTQTYNDEGLAQSKLWPKGTICMTIAANIAETGILAFDACFPDSVIGIVVNSELAEIDYVEYLLQYFKINIQSLSHGSAQENINLSTFKDKLFPFAPISEQQKIVQKLDTLSLEILKLEAIYTQKIADLDEMKKSVLQKAFSGQLNTVN